MIHKLISSARLRLTPSYVSVKPSLIVGSPKQTELGESSKKAEPTERAGDAVCDADNIEAVKPVVSQEDITKD